MGELLIDSVHECFTLEPSSAELRADEVPMLIPAGTYQCKKTFSPRLQYITPEILDVPGHIGERIHIGNEAADTSGCTIVGLTPLVNFLGDSRQAFDALMAKLPDEFEITYLNAT